jgi:ubiquinone/menaquinone biosynthesis C-methylase UbiE
MIGRRELLGAAVATAASARTLQGDIASAASPAQAAEAMQALAAVRPRGADGRLLRFASLDLESQQDFTLGFRRMHSRQIRIASIKAFERLLEQQDIDPATPLTVDQVRELVTHDPAVNIATKTWLANQQLTWKTLHDHHHRNADYYLAQMEAADRAGPGSLVLAPDLAIPDYARHEIHIQPGGYVGDPFAGHVYHYGTNSFYIGQYGHNEQDEIHRGAAGRMPLPPDGKVRRILDMGCGVGQFTVELKDRFPDAEVWGIDVGGPMVRYAHMRAARLGNGAHFAQRLAEDTGFPDGHFDLVTSYIMHHEMPADATRKVIAEAQRVTRPGGVYYPIDFHSGGAMAPARAMYSRWSDHRWNNEVWSLEYHEMNFSDEIAKRGFAPVRDARPAMQGFGARHFVKSA